MTVGACPGAFGESFVDGSVSGAPESGCGSEHEKAESRPLECGQAPLSAIPGRLWWGM